MNMKKILTSLIFICVACNQKEKDALSELELTKSDLLKKENQIDSLKIELNNCKSELQKLGFTVEMKNSSDLALGNQEIVERTRFIDTLDISDNFFVYDRDVEIIKTTGSDYENFMEHFKEMKSIELFGSEVLVMTLLNEVSLPLETENWNSQIHILVRPFELGGENSFFIISDFHYVKLLELEEIEDEAILTFEHGKFPRKKEKLKISFDKVYFENK